MAKELQEIENSELTKYIPPKGPYVNFADFEHFLEKTREWGLNSATSKKTEFWYKESFYKRKVEIVGYEIHGTYNTFVIRFLDGNLTCISPMYLKDMQSSSFGDETGSAEELEEKVKQQTKNKTPKKEEKEMKKPEEKQKESKEEKKEEKTKEKKEKMALPEEKVKLEMIVERFDTVYNSFAERDDVVVVFGNVQINDGELNIDNVWSTMSKTLEKLELKEGQKIHCEGKVVAKKLKKEVDYKLNNPSKIKIEG